jgi:HSP20 family protein
MSNIEVRRRNQDPIVPAKLQRWEPFRWMRDVMGWDPFAEMAPPWPTDERGIAYLPAFEVKETQDAFRIKADVPGVKEADLEINLTGNRLTIGGKREAEKEEKGDRYYLYDRTFGSFARTFTLPDGVDGEHIRADLKEGVLTIVLPKKPEVQAKKIGVNIEAKAKG